MSELTSIPDCRYRYALPASVGPELQGKDFAVYPIDAITASKSIVAKSTGGDFEYLDEWNKWLKENCKLSDGSEMPNLQRDEVDWLIDDIHTRYHDQKKMRYAHLNSPSSTESIPSS
jgi:hypothetical protein